MTAVTAFAGSLLKKPWIWAYIGAIGVWLGTALFTMFQGSGEVLTAAFAFATFFVIVAIGQMFVITLGPGNVDLSIPATMTLGGTVAMVAAPATNVFTTASCSALGVSRLPVGGCAGRSKCW